MNISSVVIRARPGGAAEVSDRLRAIPGVELQAAADERMVVTVEDGDGWSVEDSLLKVHQVEGVVSATLVYQYSDDARDITEAQS